MTVRIGIVGASGYTGGELIRLISAHPHFEITALAAGRSAGQSPDSVWPGLTDLGVFDGRVMETYRADGVIGNCDAVFLALAAKPGSGCPATSRMLTSAVSARAAAMRIDISESLCRVT